MRHWHRRRLKFNPQLCGAQPQRLWTDRLFRCCCYFDAVVTGEQVVKGKPAPDIFLLAAERLGLPPSECVVFEDAPSGILAAKAAGCLPVMVPDRVRPDAAIRAICRVYPSLAVAQQALLPPA